MGAHSLFLSFFPFCSSSPITTSIAPDGVGGFAHCALILFLSLALLPCLSLALLCADSAVAGVGICLINVYMDGVVKEVKMGMGRRGVEIA